MVGVVNDGLLGDAHFSRGSEPRSGVRVAIELREMAARDVDADAVAPPVSYTHLTLPTILRV